MSTFDLAVVGAGAAGLTLATCLQARGRRVVVIDKGARPGGRLAARHLGDARFDTGAVRLRVEDDAVARHLDTRLRAAGRGDLVAVGSDRWWQLADAAAVAHALLGDVEVVPALVTHLDVPDIGPVGAVVHGGAPVIRAQRIALTMPAPQVALLLARSDLDPGDRLRSVVYRPAAVLLARLAAPVAEVEVPAADAWLAQVRDEFRRGRSPVPALTVQATEPAARRGFEQDATDLTARLLTALLARAPEAVVREVSLKRWRYATVRTPLAGGTFLSLGDGRLVAAGDGFGPSSDPGRGVAQAVRSGLDAAQNC